MKIRTCTLIVLGLLLLAANPTVAQVWNNITPSTGPMPAGRFNTSAIYDPARHRMIVFGGRDGSASFNDIWAFDLSSHTWTDITPASGPMPAARFTPNTVLDSAHNQMLMWSGQGTAFFNDIWSFDLSTDTWSEFAPAGPAPNIRYGAASIFDPQAGELVTFAGFTSAGRFDDTWRFNPGSVAWNDVSPASGNPVARCLHSASYDINNHRMIVYGGQRAGALGDTWAFDLTTNTWTELLPANSPPGRFFTAHIYAAPIDHIVIFGGNLGGTKSNEVWGLDLNSNTWQMITPSGTPPAPLQGASAIYVEAEDRMIIFGGNSSKYLNEVWELTNLSTATAIEGDHNLRPQTFDLHQNSPNPFNPSTRVSFSLSEPGKVTLTVYALTGRRIATLIDAPLNSGDHSVDWNGHDEYGHEVASGVYFYRLSTGSERISRKMLLLR